MLGNRAVYLFHFGRHTYLSREEDSSFSYVPIPGIDPRSLPRVVIDEVHLPVEVLGDVPPFRKRYLPIPSPWHISLRSKSIQNLSLYRRAVDGRISVRAGARLAGRIYGTDARHSHDGAATRERTGENETGKHGTRDGWGVDKRWWGEGRGGTRDGEDGRSGRRRAGGRGGGGEGEGGGSRGSSETANGGWFRWCDEDGDKTYCTHTNTHIHTHTCTVRTEGAARPGAYTRICVRARSFFLSLSLFFSFSLSFSPSGSRALLRHHEYLIIMSGVTSESPRLQIPLERNSTVNTASRRGAARGGERR